MFDQLLYNIITGFIKGIKWAIYLIAFLCVIRLLFY